MILFTSFGRQERHQFGMFVVVMMYIHTKSRNYLLGHSREVWRSWVFFVDAPVQQSEHSKLHQLPKKCIEEIYTTVKIW